MDSKRLIKLSKYLSKHLRHQPERLGLTLAPGGWVPIAQLMEACQRHGMHFTREELDQVVAENNKQRFAIDETGTLIRANQGHSVDIDLQLEPVTPPDVLYHGTGSKTVPFIMESGLRKMSRHHVHLSPDVETAYIVGQRHGKPAVFIVDCAAMHRDGYIFYCSQNGVWLTDHVPPQYLRLLEKDTSS